MQIAALVIATIIPLLALFLIYRLDLYKTGTYRAIIICFVAGAVAFWLASMTNRMLLTRGWVSREDIIRYVAPLIEEILKGLILFYFVRKANFTYFVEGAIYGFAVGISFAVLENYQYVLAAQNAGFSVAVSRVLSTNLIHASTCGILGISLGLARFQKKVINQVLLNLGGVVVAILLHGAYNNMVSRVTSGILLIFAVASGMAAATVIIIAMRAGLKQEKKFIEEQLGDPDRVTQSEVNAIKRLDKAHDLMKPIVEKFGSKKAGQIEKFLILQARMGILRESLNRFNDEKMKQGVLLQIEKLGKEMNELRRQVGSYAMLYLRHTVLTGSSPLWNRLEAIIQAQTATRVKDNTPSVWDKLKQKQETMQKQTNKPDEES